jgi:hypothetical protein
MAITDSLMIGAALIGLLLRGQWSVHPQTDQQASERMYIKKLINL